MSMTSGKSVLIVDDSPELLKFLEKILVNVGITITKAHTVTEAWQAIQTTAPHVIITDLEMAPESGFDFLEKLRANPSYIRIPVIVLSSRGDRSAINQAMGLGAKEYVQKPLDASLILQKVKKLLHSSQFTSLDFKNMPTVEAKVPASIVAGSAGGLQVESPVRLARDSSATLETASLGAMKFDRVPTLRSSNNIAKMNERGGFLNELRFLGLTEEQMRSLEEIIRRWHTK